MSGAEECLQAAASKQRSHGWLGIADFCASVPICGLSPCEDLIRYLAAPEWLRPAEEEGVRGTYENPAAFESGPLGIQLARQTWFFHVLSLKTHHQPLCKLKGLFKCGMVQKQ